MGTSKSYKATVKGQPQWGELSSAVTRSCTGKNIPIVNLNDVLGKFVSVIGGANRAGRGQSRIVGRSGARTARRLGGFLGGLNEPGGSLSQVLASTGLPDLTDKTAEDVVNHLIEYCSGPASTIDDVAAKEATRKLLEEIAMEAETVEELEAALQASLSSESLQDIIINYFGYYILEHLSMMFYEKLVEDKGKKNCSDLFRQIKDFIRSRLREMNKNNPLNQIDWGSEAANRIIKNVQEDVLKVFEDEN